VIRVDEGQLGHFTDVVRRYYFEDYPTMELEKDFDDVCHHWLYDLLRDLQEARTALREVGQ